MYFEKFDENGIGLGKSNIQPLDMGGVFEIPDNLVHVRTRLENGVVRAETSAEFESLMASLKKKAMVPAVITMRQFKLALAKLFFLTPAATAVANSNDDALKVEWDYATDVQKSNEMFYNLSMSIGITPTQYEELFILAKDL